MQTRHQHLSKVGEVRSHLLVCRSIPSPSAPTTDLLSGRDGRSAGRQVQAGLCPRRAVFGLLLLEGRVSHAERHWRCKRDPNADKAENTAQRQTTTSRHSLTAGRAASFANARHSSRPRSTTSPCSPRQTDRRTDRSTAVTPEKWFDHKISVCEKDSAT